MVSGSLDTTHAFEVFSLYVVFVSFNWINIFFVHSICLLGVSFFCYVTEDTVILGASLGVIECGAGHPTYCR